MSRVEGFAAIPNWMVRDRSIPRNAILVYASLASRSGLGGVFPSQQVIADESGLSERTVRTMLAHLETIGVVVRVRRKRKSGRGRLSDGYTLHPNGQLVTDEAEEDQPATVAGESDDQPATDARPTGNQAQIALYTEVEPLEVEPLYTPTFVEFWSVWPRKDSRKTAEAAWRRAVTRADARVILDAAIAYASSPFRPERQFVPYGASWLNADRWSDPLPSPPEGRGVTPLMRAQETLALGDRLQIELDARREVGS